MANVQIPNLPAVAALSGEELFEGVQAGTSVKISLGQVIAATRTGTPTTIPLPISAGGTGASTAPNARTNLGLGTMSTQDADDVDITGGAINGTAIGATTPSTIAGTTGTFTGDVGIGTTTPAAQLQVEGNTTAIATITTASISGTTLTVVTVVSDTIAVGDRVYGVGVAPITRIVSQLSGTPGGAGTYTVSVSQVVGSGTMYTSSGTAATVRITDVDTTVLAGQPAGSIEFSGSDANPPGAGIGAYISAISADTSPDTNLVFGTRNAAGGGVDANERMRIDSAGNVGIGTTSPDFPLDVTSTGIGSAILSRFYVTDSTVGLIRVGNSTTGDGAAGPGFGSDGTNAVIYTNNTEKFRIESGGNVGIGTTSPVSPLHTYFTNTSTYGAGTSNLDNNSLVTIQNDSETTDSYSAIRLVSENAVGTQGVWSIASVSTASNYDNDLVFNTRTGASTYAERMRIDSAGNVGINTTSPDFPLDVTSTGIGSSIVSRFYVTDNTLGLLRVGNSTTGDGSTGPGFGSDGTNAVIYTNNTEKLRVESGGNVGIGTTPTVKLDVAGSIASTGSILSTGTAGIGYATGAGIAVTQTISRTTTTPTTGADPCGAITVFTAVAVVGTYFSFTVPNTGIAITDTVVLTVRGGTNTYVANCTSITAGTSFRVTMVSVAGVASDTPIVNFTIIKGVSA